MDRRVCSLWLDAGNHDVSERYFDTLVLQHLRCDHLCIKSKSDSKRSRSFAKLEREDNGLAGCDVCIFVQIVEQLVLLAVGITIALSG